MKLKRFRVLNFRSVEDSGWIEAEKVTALIGVNESGKTNLLLPLWKLKPARDGEIQPTSDFPKTMFGEIRSAPGEYCFIEADFWTGAYTSEISSKAGINETEAKIVRLARFYDGEYYVEFPEFKRQTSVSRAEIVSEIEKCAAKIEDGPALKLEIELQERLVKGLREVVNKAPVNDELLAGDLRMVKEGVDSLIPEEPAKTSAIVPIIRQLSDSLNEIIKRIIAPQPGEKEGVRELVVSAIPSFVYYSNYGNLDSEIYLPHVVENLSRDDLGSRESAKARTLKVLFSFVQLQPEEILELGLDFRDVHGQNREPNTEEIAEIAEKKRTRSILLQSAGATLTKKFRDWWRQGDYRFRFEADGNHFRIWVADERRPTEVELENRSTGLQWFLSFYLVFLVESKGDHKRSILLLDEPGISLHPLAQRDLSEFFESLADTNQIIYTSHSPFLVDADRLERARKVYVAGDGTTKATANLRHSEGKDEQAGAAYAVHSALNLSVAESLLVGCHPVLVEGASDQHYLAAIKSLLLSAGKIKPKRELVFPPCGGTKTARVVASILTGRDETLPFVLLDSDSPGRRLADSLKGGLYASNPERVLSVADFVGFEKAEIEDLFPAEYLAGELDRIEREPEERLSDVIKDEEPFVGQVEQWAKNQGVALDPHWKVHLSVRVKKRALSRGISDFSDAYIEKWVKMFRSFN
ncbi:ATP-dependent nuclease [Billgrantia desiderata]|uniref:AAA family ATPase n=1 Tax=Billgrantia desiderata TaxID=52021 RepID=UPI003F2D7797